MIITYTLVTSGTPNTHYVGQAFDSGLTSLITPSKSYAYKFTNTGDFSYFCRVHPIMVGEIEVVPQGKKPYSIFINRKICIRKGR